MKEEIRFISESALVDDIPKGNGRLFIFLNSETHLSDLAKKIDMVIPLEDDLEIPESVSIFIIQEKIFNIVNIPGPGIISGFIESKH